MRSRYFRNLTSTPIEDMYSAECPEIGTVDQGETIEPAIAGVTEATQLIKK